MGLEKLLRNPIARNIGLAVGIGAGMLGLAREAEAQVAEPKIVTVVPFAGGGGVGGSAWYGGVRIDNTSLTETADGTVYVLPQQDNVLAAAPQFTYSIGPRQSLIIPNLAEYFTSIGDPQSIAGNVSVKVVPSDDVGVGANAIIKNEQNLHPDNEYVIDPHNTNVTTTDLLTAVPGVSQSRLLLPGDYVTIAAPDVTKQEYGDPVRTKAMHRLNMFFYGEQDDQGDDPDLMCERYLPDASLEGTKYIDLNVNGGRQITNFISSTQGFNRTPVGNESIRCVVLNGKVWILPSSVKNNVDLDGVDDGYAIEPTISRLVEEASYTSSPNEVEANDPLVTSIYMRSRPGTEITGGSISGGIGQHIDGNGTNELRWHRTDFPTAAGTYDNTGGLTILTNDGEFTRALPEHTLTVEAEQDYTPVDSHQKTKDNISALADLIGNNINTVYRGDNTHYFEDDMTMLLDMYTNGSTSDPEIDHVEVLDSINRLVYVMSTGGNAVWDGFTEPQMETLDTIYK